jgi:NAD-dependent SIR2 family protein deacetylase
MNAANTEELLARAARAVAVAEAVVVGAGAGMGVDSGMPDFRSQNGFWGNYPLLNGQRIDVLSMCNPDWFRNDPEFAWGFYGHRLNLYRTTAPHGGFAILKKWSDRAARGSFVYTSNIDAHFQVSGFAPHRIYEVHGSLRWMQCMAECGIGLFSSDQTTIEVDESNLHARRPLPTCRACGALARPNIVLYGDDGFDSTRADDQFFHLKRWVNTLKDRRVVVIECGAGMTIPTVRDFCEDTARNLGATLVRINTSEPWAPDGAISLAMGAREALERIDYLVDGAR